MFEVILFDLDNTLYDYKCHEIALNSTLTKFNIYELKNEFDIMANELKIDLLNTSSCHSRLIYFKKLIERFNLILNPLDLNDFYWTIFYENIKLFDGVLNLLNIFKNQTIKMGIITNFTLEHQLHKLKMLNIDKYFDHITTSEEVLLEKPHPLIFYTILNKFDCLPKNALMIGDSYKNDIIPALKIGMNAIHINDCEYKIENYIQMKNMEYLYHFYFNTFEELKKLSFISRRIGERFDLVQAGGGNISFKYNDLMFIKSSGVCISDIDIFSGYSIVNNKKLAMDLSNNIYKSIMDYVILRKNKPSIETYMHSFLKKFTVHIHPIETNFYLIQKDSNFLKDVFPNALFIDYITPGKILAKVILDKYNQENIIFLKNHGIIVSSDNYNEILDLIDDIMKQCDINIYNKYQPVNKISIMLEHTYKKKFCTKLVDHEFMINNLDRINPITVFPDKAVYCGHCFFNDELTKENLEQFYIKNKDIPKIIIYKNNIYISANSLKKCNDIESVLMSHIMLLKQNNSIQELSITEIDYLINWEDEKFRMK